MTAKDKAKELFDKYCHAIRTEECDDGYFTNVVHAKRCALIAVDELINHSMPSSEFGGYVQSYTIEYFEDVKKEIEKL